MATNIWRSLCPNIAAAALAVQHAPLVYAAAAFFQVEFVLKGHESFPGHLFSWLRISSVGRDIWRTAVPFAWLSFFFNSSTALSTAFRQSLPFTVGAADCLRGAIEDSIWESALDPFLQQFPTKCGQRMNCLPLLLRAADSKVFKNCKYSVSTFG